MSNGNESCMFRDGAEFVACIFHAFEEWSGLGPLEDYLSYLEYLAWVFTPLVVVFILPFLIVILLYFSILFLHVYKHKNQLREAYSNNLWDGARKTLATLRDVLFTQSLITFCSKFQLLLEVFSVIHGPQEECVKALKSGHLLGISPGGVREALLSDETYPLVWGKRKGFAQGRIPISRRVKWSYEKFRMPMAPVYGGFPVKFRTYLGDPIPYDPNISAAELAEKTKQAVQALIDRHQIIPGNVLRALLERFHSRHKEK
ncbi:unnamed protein product [Coregonus sp. 'balchen']|nr:unnamed protein product [Coregonus sp. 'balchen']